MSAPLEAAKTSAASPPPPSASPAPAAPKKRAKRAAPSSADGTTAPAPKKAKKAEAATDGNGGVVAAKKAAPKRKPKEAEETEEATVEPKEMAKRLAEIEAEEQDMAGKGLDDENDANSWQDSLYVLCSCKLKTCVAILRLPQRGTIAHQLCFTATFALKNPIEPLCHWTL